MKVAVGQWPVNREWQHNAAQISEFMHSAEQHGAELLVLPEAVLARDNDQSHWVIEAAQPLDGSLVTQLLAVSKSLSLTTILTLHVPASEGKARNVLIA